MVVTSYCRLAMVLVTWLSLLSTRVWNSVMRDQGSFSLSWKDAMTFVGYHDGLDDYVERKV